MPYVRAVNNTSLLRVYTYHLYGLSPRVRLERNPEIPVAPGEEQWLLDTSLDEVYWPCSHSRAIPSFPSQLEWKIGLPWANTRGSQRCSPRRASLPSPRLLMADAGVCAASPLGELP